MTGNDPFDFTESNNALMEDINKYQNRVIGTGQQNPYQTSPANAPATAAAPQADWQAAPANLPPARMISRTGPLNPLQPYMQQPMDMSALNRTQTKKLSRAMALQKLEGNRQQQLANRAAWRDRQQQMAMMYGMMQDPETANAAAHLAGINSQAAAQYYDTNSRRAIAEMDNASRQNIAAMELKNRMDIANLEYGSAARDTAMKYTPELMQLNPTVAGSLAYEQAYNEHLQEFPKALPADREKFARERAAVAIRSQMPLYKQMADAYGLGSTYNPDPEYYLNQIPAIPQKPVYENSPADVATGGRGEAIDSMIKRNIPLTLENIEKESALRGYGTTNIDTFVPFANTYHLHALSKQLKENPSFEKLQQNMAAIGYRVTPEAFINAIKNNKQFFQDTSSGNALALQNWLTEHGKEIPGWDQFVKDNGWPLPKSSRPLAPFSNPFNPPLLGGKTIFNF